MNKKQIKIMLDPNTIYICNSIVNDLKAKGIKASFSDIINLLVNHGFYNVEINSQDIEMLYVQYKQKEKIEGTLLNDYMERIKL